MLLLGLWLMPLFHLDLQRIVLIGWELIQRFHRLERLLDHMNTSFFRDSWLLTVCIFHLFYPFRVLRLPSFSLLVLESFLVLLPQVI